MSERQEKDRLLLTDLCTDIQTLINASVILSDQREPRYAPEDESLGVALAWHSIEGSIVWEGSSSKQASDAFQTRSSQ